MKKILDIHSNAHRHWVGNGFPVCSLFSYHRHGECLSPFLLLDYAGPAAFEPTHQQRGVGEHPHRGFETVTIVYQGEVAHRDSTGQGGVIGPGDVQWMTAGSGILHEEFHSEAFAQSGGTLQMIQLWVNLPAKHKMTAPRYQAITKADIPVVFLPDQSGFLRVIAGQYADQQGPAMTFSPVHVFDIRLTRGTTMTLPAIDGWNTALVILAGSIRVNGERMAIASQVVIFDAEGHDFTVDVEEDVVMLVLSGEPILEPIVGHGPFVMNTQAEIEQAINDFNRGDFGKIEGAQDSRD